MKIIKIRIKTLAGIVAFLGILTLGACGSGERNETDYVNEIEAAESTPGEPYLEDLSESPTEIEAEEDTLAPDEGIDAPELEEGDL